MPTSTNPKEEPNRHLLVMPQSIDKDNGEFGKYDQTSHHMAPTPHTPSSPGRLSPAPQPKEIVASAPGSVGLPPQPPLDDPEALCDMNSAMERNYGSSATKISPHSRGYGFMTVHSPVSDVHIAHFLPQSDPTPLPQTPSELTPKPNTAPPWSGLTSVSSQLLTPSPESKPVGIIGNSEEGQSGGSGGGGRQGVRRGTKEWVDDPDIFHSNGKKQRQEEPGRHQAPSHSQSVGQLHDLHDLKLKGLVQPDSILQDEPGKGGPDCSPLPGRRAATMTGSPAAKLELDDTCREHHVKAPSSPSAVPPVDFEGVKVIKPDQEGSTPATAHPAVDLPDGVVKEERKILVPATNLHESTEPPEDTAASARAAHHGSSEESHSGRLEEPVPKIEDFASPVSTPPLSYEQHFNADVGPKVEYELSQDTPPTSPVLTPVRREGGDEETVQLALRASRDTESVWQADAGSLKDKKPSSRPSRGSIMTVISALDTRAATTPGEVSGASNLNPVSKADLSLAPLRSMDSAKHPSTPTLLEVRDTSGQTLTEKAHMTLSNETTFHGLPKANLMTGKIKQSEANKSAIHDIALKLKKFSKLQKSAHPSIAAKSSSYKKVSSTSAKLKPKNKAAIEQKGRSGASHGGSKVAEPHAHKRDSTPARMLQDVQPQVNDEVEALPEGCDPWSEDESGGSDVAGDSSEGGMRGESMVDETENTELSGDEDDSTPPLSSGTTASEGDDTEYIPTDEPYTRRPWRQREKTRSPSPTLVVKRTFAKPVVPFAQSADELGEEIKAERADGSVESGGRLLGLPDNEATLPPHRRLVRTASASSRQSGTSLGPIQSIPSTQTQGRTRLSSPLANTSTGVAPTQALKPSHRRTSAHTSSSWTLAHVPRKDGERYAVAMLGKVLGKWVAEGAWGRRDQVLRVLGTKGSSWTSHLSPAQLFDKWQCVLEAEVDGLREAGSGKGRRRAGDVRMV